MAASTTAASGSGGERTYLTQALEALRNAADGSHVVLNPVQTVKGAMGVSERRAAELCDRLKQLGLCSQSRGIFRVRAKGEVPLEGVRVLLRGGNPRTAPQPRRELDDAELRATMRDWVSRVVQAGDVWELRESARDRHVRARFEVKHLEVVGRGLSRTYRVALVAPVPFVAQLAPPGTVIEDDIVTIDGDIFYTLATRGLLVLARVRR